MAKQIIYLEDRELVLTDSISSDLGDEFNAVHEYSTNHDLDTFLQRFVMHDEIKRAVIFWQDLEQLLLRVKRCFVFIQAGGGLVRNPENAYLFIFRRGKWDLPKGKQETNETMEQTALREVEEECGVQGLVIEKELASTYHLYLERNKTILKRTWWYLMSAPIQQGKPQQEEGITAVNWLMSDDLDKVVKNTYPSVLNVLRGMR